MNDKLGLDDIRRFWEAQAREHGESPDASWSDTPVIDLEIRALAERLPEGASVLDAGCANGYTTLHLAALKKADFLGIDYIPEMIAAAERRLSQMRPMLRGTARFAVGDITAIDQPDESFDAVMAVRVLINLESWENQRRAVVECARVAKPGGLVLFSEATLQGWRRMNAFRGEWGLSPIPMPAFNEYLDEEAMADAAPALECVDVVNFASTYFAGTRVFKPLLAQLLGNEAIVNRPDAEWNRFFAQLPAWGDYGTQKLFVYRKRG